MKAHNFLSSAGSSWEEPEAESRPGGQPAHENTTQIWTRFKPITPIEFSKKANHVWLREHNFFSSAGSSREEPRAESRPGGQPAHETRLRVGLNHYSITQWFAWLKEHNYLSSAGSSWEEPGAESRPGGQRVKLRAESRPGEQSASARLRTLHPECTRLQQCWDSMNVRLLRIDNWGRRTGWRIEDRGLRRADWGSRRIEN